MRSTRACEIGGCTIIGRAQIGQTVTSWWSATWVDCTNAYGVRRLEDLAENPDVRLVVIGTGPQLAWLREHVPDAKFLEPMSTGDLGTAIASLDVLIHPGRKLTCGHSLRAAAASGIPVIGTRRGAATEIVIDEETGLLYDSTMSTAITDAIKRLHDPDLRGVLGAAARITAEQRDWSVAVN